MNNIINKIKKNIKWIIGLVFTAVLTFISYKVIFNTNKMRIFACTHDCATFKKDMCHTNDLLNRYTDDIDGNLIPKKSQDGKKCKVQLCDSENDICSKVSKGVFVAGKVDAVSCATEIEKNNLKSIYTSEDLYLYVFDNIDENDYADMTEINDYDASDNEDNAQEISDVNIVPESAPLSIAKPYKIGYIKSEEVQALKYKNECEKQIGHEVTLMSYETYEDMLEALSNNRFELNGFISSKIEEEDEGVTQYLLCSKCIIYDNNKNESFKTMYNAVKNNEYDKYMETYKSISTSKKITKVDQMTENQDITDIDNLNANINERKAKFNQYADKIAAIKQRLKKKQNTI